MDLLIRLLIGIAIIWLVQTFVGAVGLKDPAGRIIFLVALILVVLWLIGVPLLFR